MVLKIIPNYIAFTIILFLGETYSRELRRISDFSKEYFKDVNYDSLNDLEMPMVENANPGPVSIIMMKDTPPLTPGEPIFKQPENLFETQPIQMQRPEEPIFKPPERSFPEVPYQEPIKDPNNNIAVDSNISLEKKLALKMGENSDTFSETSSELSESGLDVDVSENKFDSIGDGKYRVLRKASRSCNKKARRRCTKACKAAYKLTCADYHCSRRRKKAFKRSCKSNCRRNFI